MAQNILMSDQLDFAALSGDYNKLHVDEVAARRLLFGRPAVHGLHLVFLALEEWAKSLQRPFELVSLKANFRKPLLIGESLRIQIAEDSGSKIVFKLFHQEDMLTDIMIVNADRRLESDPIRVLSFAGEKCKKLTIEEIASAGGKLELSLDMTLIRKHFPALADYMPALQSAELLACTRLIGMECPGENSLFSDMRVEFKDPVAGNALAYKVLEYDQRFSKAIVHVEGPSITGNLGAFVRPSPKDQASFAEIKSKVAPGEFSDQSALIIGGSRGLGEAVAKILAAGGSKVLITYVKGSEDALRIREELGREGCRIESLLFDVTKPEKADQSAIGAFAPTHLYYFATGFIRTSGKIFSQELFDAFCTYYVSGFSASADVIAHASGRLKHLFYPSSVYVVERPKNLAEYAAAKAAGEEECLSYHRKRPDLRIYAPRLPKMSTDQTQSLYAGDTEIDPVSVMLEHVRIFQTGSDEASSRTISDRS